MEAPGFVVVPLYLQHRIAATIAALPSLTHQDVPLDDSCPICLVPFVQILQGLDHAESPDAAVEEPSACGITKLPGCGHLFCRKE